MEVMELVSFIGHSKNYSNIDQVINPNIQFKLNSMHLN